MVERGLTAIMHLSNNCNLVCSYCMNNTKLKIDMSREIASISIEKIVQYNGKNKQSHFIWHGGEPLIVGLDFFEYISEFQKGFVEYKIKNSVQTNGILLNDDFAEFFRENNFRVSFSLDGNNYYNDLTRKFLTGEGTFDKVLKAIRLAREKGIGKGQ